MKAKFRRALVGAGLAVSSAAAVAVPSYACERLGLAHDDWHARTAAINARGEIVGVGIPDDFTPFGIAVKWSKRLHAQRLNHTHRATDAVALNDAGQVVGSVTLSDQRQRAITWIDGTEVALGGLSGSHAKGYAIGINSAGQIVGGSTPVKGTSIWHATLWDHGSVVDLVGPGDDRHSAATHINDDGLIVGYRYLDGARTRVHPVSWDHGVMTYLDVLDGGESAVAVASNRRGTVVGWSNHADTGPNFTHAVAWRHGKVIDLGLLAGDDMSRTAGINDSGVIVGMSLYGDLNFKAVVWFDLKTGPTDLNTLLAGDGCLADDGSPVALVWATAINRHGQIAAFGVRESDYRQFGFRLTPQ